MGQKLQLLRVRMHVSVLGSLLKASDYFSHASLPQEAQCRELSRSLEDAACCRPATFAIPSIVQGCFMHLSIHSLCADDIKKQKQEEHAAGKPTLDSPSPNGQLLSVSDYLHCDGKLRRSLENFHCLQSKRKRLMRSPSRTRSSSLMRWRT